MSESSPPIFIVGASRSGTAMMRSILCLHKNVHIAGETHYFDDLRTHLDAPSAGPMTDEERQRCEDYFLALSHRPYGHQGEAGKGWLQAAELRKTADAIGEGGDAWFQAYCQLSSQREGTEKTIWGEKTPRHIFRIGDILSVYPDARIICMVRDARAVVASYRDWRNQGGFDLEKDPTHAQALTQEEKRVRKSYNILLISMLWRSAAKTAIDARSQFGDGRVRVQLYEQLVADPESMTREITDWLGIEFDAAMLDVPMHNSSFSQFKSASGVSTEPVRRWRQKLSDREIAVVQSCAGAVLRDAGYELESVPVPAPILWWEWVKLPFAAVRATMANRDRMGNIPQYIWRRLKLSSKA